ncbi:MAG: hypothetical protein OEZ13_10780 [Spirochaetia bacterium]|nr:hypothetical protein [Spirochaetia bacterium]
MKSTKIIKTIVFGAVFLIAATTSSLQAKESSPFKEGDIYVGASVGPGFWGGAMIAGNFEYAVSKFIGVGGLIGYLSYDEKVWSTTYSYTVIPVGVTVAYHFTFIKNKNLDVSAGVFTGYYSYSVDSTSTLTGAAVSTFAVGAYGACRYYVAENIALKAKLGYGASFAEFGVDFKL